MAVAIPLAGVIYYLLADPSVRNIVDDRIVIEIEGEANQDRSVPYLSLNDAGGPRDSGYAGKVMCRVDSFAYADTPFNASRLFWEVRHSLKQLERTVTPHAVIVSVIPTAGPVWGRDSDNDRVMIFGSYEVFAYEEV